MRRLYAPLITTLPVLLYAFLHTQMVESAALWVITSDVGVSFGHPLAYLGAGGLLGICISSSYWRRKVVQRDRVIQIATSFISRQDTI